jgi:hypothetical protein
MKAVKIKATEWVKKFVIYKTKNAKINNNNLVILKALRKDMIRWNNLKLNKSTLI